MGDRTCVACGGRLESEYAQKYCSQECFREDHSFAGENNPNYKGGKERTECEICGSEFEYYPSEKGGLYCPGCVKTEDWRDPPVIGGEANPRWNGGKVERECAVCDDIVERYPSEFNGEIAVRSEACRRAWLSEAFTGEGHPNWKGGGNEPYGKGWNRVRKRALERDGYRCLACRKSKDEMGRNPDVHHIVPVRAFVDSDGHTKEDAHTLDNVVSLCIDCHRKADFGKITRAGLRSLIDVDP